MKTKYSFFPIVFFLYMALVFALAFYPRLAVPQVPEGISADKIAHFLQYFIFSYLFFKMRVTQKVRRREIYIELFLIGILVSVFTEEIQGLIPGRAKCWLDTLANLLGFYSFILCSTFIHRKRKANA